MWGLSASEALAGLLARLCRPGLGLLQSILRHQVTQAKSDRQLFPGLIQSSTSKTQWESWLPGWDMSAWPRETCLHGLLAPSGASWPQEQEIPRYGFCPLELNWSTFSVRLTGLWVGWGWQCAGTGGLKGSIGAMHSWQGGHQPLSWEWRLRAGWCVGLGLRGRWGQRQDCAGGVSQYTEGLDQLPATWRADYRLRFGAL